MVVDKSPVPYENTVFPGWHLTIHFFFTLRPNNAEWNKITRELCYNINSRYPSRHPLKKLFLEPDRGWMRQCNIP